jgi:hypothetical protein
MSVGNSASLEELINQMIMKNFKWMVVAVVYFAFAKANTHKPNKRISKAIAHYVAQTKFDIKPDTTKKNQKIQRTMR